LPLAIEDPQAAEAYSKHSIVAEGSFEPFGFTLISFVGKWLNIWEGNTSTPLTTTYLLHPLTIAGMAGFYICGMNLLPASYLNGGFLVRAKFGRRAHTLFTYLVIILLITVQWLVALLILFLNDRLGSPEILNEESELTGKSTFWISVALLITVISFPIHI
jgi:membrane-associated protease RseP (regulator of RpoE activity)